VIFLAVNIAMGACNSCSDTDESWVVDKVLTESYNNDNKVCGRYQDELELALSNCNITYSIHSSNIKQTFTVAICTRCHQMIKTHRMRLAQPPRIPRQSALSVNDQRRINLLIQQEEHELELAIEQSKSAANQPLFLQPLNQSQSQDQSQEQLESKK
jgi:hypothetical protein